MRWKDLRRSSNVNDVRGSGGGMRTGIPLSFGGRGGGIGVVVILIRRVHLWRPRCRQHAARRRRRARRRATKAPPLTSNDEASQFVAAMLGSTEDVWGAIFEQSGSRYSAPQLTLFDGAVQSACGYASAAVGPFYCPSDRRVYLDTAFFRDLANLGGPGDFAQAYVIGHEVGHHVQNLLGTADQVRGAQQRGGEAAANRLQVAMELQADCYAGVWAHHANQTRSSARAGRRRRGPRGRAGDRRRSFAAQRGTARHARFVHARLVGRSAALARRRPRRPAIQARAIRSSNLRTDRMKDNRLLDGRAVRDRILGRGRGARTRPRRPRTRSGGWCRSASARTKRSRVYVRGQAKRGEEGRHSLRRADLAERADARGMQGTARRDERRCRTCSA